MALRYESVVPWGRSFDEYCRMFGLSERELGMRILGCGDGPASFNAEMRRRGRRVVSCDPLYQFTAAQIAARIDATYDTVMNQTRANQDRFVWRAIPSPDELGRVRMSAMRDFLDDYGQAHHDGRYVAAELPALPFQDASFDLALCSHFLFLYTDNLSLEFHAQAVEAMRRVAGEVRIFPLLTYNADVSPYVQPVAERLRAIGRRVFIEPAPYEFQRGGNQMMRIV